MHAAVGISKLIDLALDAAILYATDRTPISLVVDAGVTDAACFVRAWHAEEG